MQWDISGPDDPHRLGRLSGVFSLEGRAPVSPEDPASSSAVILAGAQELIHAPRPRASLQIETKPAPPGP